MTQTVEELIADTSLSVACQTDRVPDCPNEVEYYVVLSCCGVQSPLCGTHAKQGIAEWDAPVVVLGILEYICGYCDANPMPRPTWRKI